MDVPFHEQLRYERERRGWSQADVAEKVGSDTKTVGRWEMGKSLPRPYFRKALCELFEMDAVELGLIPKTTTSHHHLTPSPPDAPDKHLPPSDPSRKSAVPHVPDVGPMPALEPPGRNTDEVVQHNLQSEDRNEVSFIHSYSAFLSAEEIPELGTKLHTYDIHSNWVIAVDWQPGGKLIASAGADGIVQILHADTGQHLLTYRGHALTGFLARTKFQPTIYNVSWSPKEPLIASSGAGKVVRVWDAKTGKTLFTYRSHSGLLTNVYAIAWSPDGTSIASACTSTGTDRTIHIWDVKTARTIQRLNTSCGLAPNFSVLALAWSPDGSRIAGTCGDKTIHIWNASSGNILATYTASDWVSDLAWSPDGKLLATANSDHTAQIWDTSKDEIILTYSGHSERVRDVAWSPDGILIASASNDKTVQIWEAATGKHFFTYCGHTEWVTSAVWSSDGMRIASGSNDKTVQVWQAKKVTAQIPSF